MHKDFFFLVFILFIFSCAQKENTAVEIKKAPDIPVEVKTELAFKGKLVKYLQTEGVAQAFRKTPVIFFQSGYLIKMVSKEGETVKKGKLIAQIENDQQAINLAESKAALIKAITEFAAQTADKKEAIALLNNKNNYFNSKDYFNNLDSLALSILSGRRRAETLMAHSGLSQAYTAYRRALLDYQKTMFYALFDGIVGEVTVKQGEYVKAGSPVCWLYDLSRIKIEVEVLENEAPLVSIGNSCEVIFTALKNKIFKGTIYSKNVALNQDRHTLRLTVLLANHASGITPGMSSTVKIAIKSEKETLLVPKKAVLERDGRFLVFVVRDSIANWCYITPGESNDKYMQVLSSEFNLKSGEPVIVDGQFTLAHGARVKVIN
ncbi:MAG: efflux RND transporter periplasmic adaptor subunit [Calditrichaeota bacterium]|nr:efflux RND transporter periplasmic adaptor subunit [Calditrichota bacterium]